MADEALQRLRGARGEPVLVEIAGSDRRPDPDPTVLTTQAVERAAEQWRRDIGALRTYLESRLDDLKELKAAHFTEVRGRIDALEASRVEHKADTRDNNNKLMEMQQRAIDKSEKGFADQLSQLDKAQDTNTNDLRRSIEDVKHRITAVEQQKVGAKDNSVLIGGGVAVILLVLAMMGWIASHNPPSAPIQISPAAGGGGGRVEVK